MKNILILEDDMITQQLYSMLLKDKGVYLCFCRTINEALISLMKMRFDLIISCLSVEERNCIQFLRLVHYWKDKTPLLLITGNHEVRTEIPDVESIVSSIVFKPFKKEELLEVINATLIES